MKKQAKLDQHQILVCYGDVDHFSIWPLKGTLMQF